jgi:hypothetical protein
VTVVSHHVQTSQGESKARLASRKSPEARSTPPQLNPFVSRVKRRIPIRIFPDEPYGANHPISASFRSLRQEWTKRSLPEVVGCIINGRQEAGAESVLTFEKEIIMSEIAYEGVDRSANFFTYEISDEALEAAAGSALMSGTSNPGVNCTGGCKI